MLKAPINSTSELKNFFDSVNEALSAACELALKQPIPGKQLVLMSDASSRSAGYALMIEDIPDQRIQSKRKTYAPVALGSKIVSPAQLRMSTFSKKSFGNLKGISSVDAQFVRSNRTDKRPDRQKIGQAIFPDQSNATSTVECYVITHYNLLSKYSSSPV